MRRIAIPVAALVAIAPAGTLLASAPPDSPPVATEAPVGTEAPAGTEAAATEPAGTEPMGSAPAGSEPGAAPAGEPVPIYDDRGTQLAAIQVTSVEVGWSDYAEDDTPGEGEEYVRVGVVVTSMHPDGTFAVEVGHFQLQDNWGYTDSADNIRTAAQVESDEDVQGEADLENGETAELTLTFSVNAAAGPQSVLYTGDDRIVDVVEVAQG